MRKTLLCLFLLVSVGMIAQKIKTKKNIISIDNVEAAKVYKRENKATKETNYVFYDMQDKDSVSFRSYMIEAETYYSFKTSLATDTADLKFVLQSFTFNWEKALTELIVKKYKFITSNGLEKETIKDYIAKQEEKLIPAALEDIEGRSERYVKAKAMNLGITPDSEIMSQGNKIGDVIRPSSLEANKPLLFVDNARHTIASITDYNRAHGATVAPAVGKEFYANFSHISPEADAHAYILFQLAKRDYLPGQAGYAEYAAQNTIEDVKKLKEARRMNTVYGELELKKYRSIIGFFKCQFRQKENGRMVELKDLPEFSQDNYDGLQITVYPSSERLDGRDFDKIDFSEGRVIPIEECKSFVIHGVYDTDPNGVEVEEAYYPLSYSPVLTKLGLLGKITSETLVHWTRLIGPINYSGAAKFDDVLILMKMESLKEMKYKTLARDVFKKKDLLNFTKEYEAMKDKIEENADEYLKDEAGLTKFAKDFDRVIIDSKKW